MRNGHVLQSPRAFIGVVVALYVVCLMRLVCAQKRTMNVHVNLDDGKILNDSDTSFRTASAEKQYESEPKSKGYISKRASYEYREAGSGCMRQNAYLAARFPGATRSKLQRDWALVAPESRVFGFVPAFTNVVGANVISPAMNGAHFSMYVVMALQNSAVRGIGSGSEAGNERFIFVLEGALQVEFPEDKDSTCNRKSRVLLRQNTSSPDDRIFTLLPGGFVYLPPRCEAIMTSGMAFNNTCSFVVLDRVYAPSSDNVADLPLAVLGAEADVPVEPVPGEMFMLRRLLPQTPDYDFNFHVMDYEPGEYLNAKEMHYNQHGLLMLEGQGIYRLADEWFPVAAGDVIYMGPFVPQWYAALGHKRSRYLLYKDTARDPLRMFSH
ncbi:putative (S)-ureidoglycine aminohydrolase [Porphyridium purpureum]|uniref:Putative (S)-ureidoglycine aminohydrolase n=1 Tax=Porphyridium purpureum TaxID=35688 RepID=A0A5J4YKR0_PORPP|nr:putative (S)-ureidoglycine aminohydrolase [Porphyridium purpureum]|eukprot:POR9878..scf297_16